MMKLLFLWPAMLLEHVINLRVNPVQHSAVKALTKDRTEEKKSFECLFPFVTE